MGVRIIPAQMATPVQTEGTAALKPQKLKVAAYCRVSTELEEQESSFEAQVQHYTDFITANLSWELAGIFADEGLSGTGTRKRGEFNKMIVACERGEINMVITKSISRFARNTLDCLKYIRKLKALDIPILFEKENINTMESSGEMLITIMASIAQQESQSISQNVRMGHQYRMQQGKPLTRGGFMGYRMSEDKSYLVIEPEEAVVVRRIYREFLEGKSPTEIKTGLEKDGIKSPSGNDHWYESCVRSMLRNEKFMGDLLLQKYYIKDFISKQAVRNNGTFPKYYVENAHDPIVPKEVFLQVQGELLRREHEREMTGKRKVFRDTPLFGKVYCAECGNLYQRFQNKNYGKVDLRCKTRIRKGTPCTGRIVREDVVTDAVVEAFQKVPDFREYLEEELREVTESGELRAVKEELTALDEREDAIREQISQYAESGRLDHAEDGGEDAVTAELDEMKVKLDAIHSEKNDRMRRKAEFDNKVVQLKSLLKLIRSMQEDVPPEPDAGEEETDPDNRFGRFWPEIKRQTAKYAPACTEAEDFFERTEERKHHGPITEFDNDDAIRYIDKVVIHQDKIVVMFKAGVSVEVFS